MIKFKILETEKRHAEKNEYITPIGLPRFPPICKVNVSYFEPRFMNADNYTMLHEGTGYVDCIALGKLERLQFYEYEVVTKWEGDIEYALKNYRLEWLLD